MAAALSGGAGLSANTPRQAQRLACGVLSFNPCRSPAVFILYSTQAAGCRLNVCQICENCINIQAIPKSYPKLIFAPFASSHIQLFPALTQHLFI